MSVLDLLLNRSPDAAAVERAKELRAKALAARVPKSVNLMASQLRHPAVAGFPVAAGMGGALMALSPLTSPAAGKLVPAAAVAAGSGKKLLNIADEHAILGRLRQFDDGGLDRLELPERRMRTALGRLSYGDPAMAAARKRARRALYMGAGSGAGKKALLGALLAGGAFSAGRAGLSALSDGEEKTASYNRISRVVSSTPLATLGGAAGGAGTGSLLALLGGATAMPALGVGLGGAWLGARAAKALRPVGRRLSADEVVEKVLRARQQGLPGDALLNPRQRKIYEHAAQSDAVRNGNRMRNMGVMLGTIPAAGAGAALAGSLLGGRDD